MQLCLSAVRVLPVSIDCHLSMLVSVRHSGVGFRSMRAVRVGRMCGSCTCLVCEIRTVLGVMQGMGSFGCVEGRSMFLGIVHDRVWMTATSANAAEVDLSVRVER